MRQLLLAISLAFSVSVHAQQQITITCPKCGHAIKVSISVDGAAAAIHDNDSIVATSGQCKAITARGTQCSRKARWFGLLLATCRKDWKKSNHNIDQ